ncbi:MAG: hypothetical protein QM744_19555 [Mesorhizobium sp.]
MYFPFVIGTMLVLPLASAGIDLWLHPDLPLMLALGRWFVFWGAGVRLIAAGLKQTLQPEFTAKEIFKLKTDEAFPIVRELGISNFAGGVVGIASVFAPSFLLPIAIYATIFYGAAGIGHIGQKDRSANENLALCTDLLIAVVLLAFVIWSVA